jgi:hypothetical protein
VIETISQHRHWDRNVFEHACNIRKLQAYKFDLLLLGALHDVVHRCGHRTPHSLLISNSIQPYLIFPTTRIITIFVYYELAQAITRHLGSQGIHVIWIDMEYMRQVGKRRRDRQTQVTSHKLGLDSDAITGIGCHP